MSAFLALLRFERAKLTGRAITWVPFLVLTIVVALIVAVFHRLQFNHMLQLLRAAFNLGGKDDFVNGYYMAAHAMNPVFQMLIPLFVVVAAGLMVAGEAERGTLRACLVRPVSRRALILSKFALLTGYALALCFFLLLLLIGAGILNFGTGNLYTLNVLFHNGNEGASMIPEAEMPMRLLAAGGLATLGMMVLAALGILVSALVDTPAMAFVITLSIYFACLILRLLPDIDWLYPYLFVTHMLRWQQCFFSYFRTGEILVSTIHLAGYLIAFLSAAVLLFEERDIKS
ncbi:MAG: ABC transporter permease [Planctomycetota bacterium]|nr:ABC transporter permease [Planctomycetota bacterium]